jgi:hypothetical protein
MSGMSMVHLSSSLVFKRAQSNFSPGIRHIPFYSPHPPISISLFPLAISIFTHIQITLHHTMLDKSQSTSTRDYVENIIIGAGPVRRVNLKNLRYVKAKANKCRVFFFFLFFG